MFLNLLICVFLFVGVHSARILGIFHEKSFSHQVLGTKLLFGLASRGHEVTMLTPVLPKSNIKNFSAIHLDLHDEGTSALPNLFDFRTARFLTLLMSFDEIGMMWTEPVLKDANVRQLLQSNVKFDVVIMEQLGNYALKGICHHYQAHCITLSTMGPTFLTNEQMGNPNNPSYMPDAFVDYSPNMNFYERLRNTFVSLSQQVYFQYSTIEKHNELMQRHFPGSPHLREILYNTSLVLLNSHYSTSNPVPNTPNVIEIGGFHIDPPKKLPHHIQEYLDEASDGVIYFSMGSILSTKNMHEEKLKDILNVFGKSKQKILWKVDENISNLPPNVKTMKWVPQIDVLAHPNVRVFISHGGLLSTTEAIYCGVPILGIPVFGDQGLNIALAEYLGYGIGVPYETLNEDNFGRALNAILTKSKYRDNAKQRSKVFHDQPMKPLDKAIFWIEYVIRHKGAPHLRTAALDLTWYQYLLLDVLLVVIFCISLMLYTLRKLCSNLFGKKVALKRNETKKKKQ